MNELVVRKDFKTSRDIQVRMPRGQRPQKSTKKHTPMQKVTKSANKRFGDKIDISLGHGLWVRRHHQDGRILN